MLFHSSGDLIEKSQLHFILVSTLSYMLLHKYHRPNKNRLKWVNCWQKIVESNSIITAMVIYLKITCLELFEFWDLSLLSWKNLTTAWDVEISFETRLKHWGLSLRRKIWETGDLKSHWCLRETTEILKWSHFLFFISMGLINCMNVERGKMEQKEYEKERL